MNAKSHNVSIYLTIKLINAHSTTLCSQLLYFALLTANRFLHGREPQPVSRQDLHPSAKPLALSFGGPYKEITHLQKTIQHQASTTYNIQYLSHGDSLMALDGETLLQRVVHRLPRSCGVWSLQMRSISGLIEYKK